MRRHTRMWTARFALGLPWLLLAASASAQEKTKLLAVEQGWISYRAHCAVCHGKSGEGDGPLADQLRFAPPDLTRLARRNRGKFDSEMVQRIIDGRWPVKGHGGPEMPVWGDVFLEPRKGYSRDAIRQRIVELTAFLATIQKR